MKKILLADKDEGLRDAFRVVFPVDEYDFFYTSDGSSIDRIALEYKPDIYIVNVDLDKKDGIEVYEDLQDRELLQKAHFFFLKDINKKIDLSGYKDITGIIDKPINFFRVHQMIAELEDTIPKLQDAETTPSTTMPQVETQKIQESMIMQEILKEPKIVFKFQDDQETIDFEEQLKKAVKESLETLKDSLIEKLTPIISNYMKNYSRQILSDVAEKVVREEMETLLASIRKSK